MSNEIDNEDKKENDARDNILDLSDELSLYLSLDEDSQLDNILNTNTSNSDKSTATNTITTFDDILSLTIDDNESTKEEHKKPTTKKPIETLPQNTEATAQTNQTSDIAICNFTTYDLTTQKDSEQKIITEDNNQNIVKETPDEKANEKPNTPTDASIIYAAFAPRNKSDDDFIDDAQGPDYSKESDINVDNSQQFKTYTKTYTTSQNAKAKLTSFLLKLYASPLLATKRRKIACGVFILLIICALIFTFSASNSQQVAQISPDIINAALARHKKNIKAYKQAEEQKNKGPIITWQSKHEVAQPDGNTNFKLEFTLYTRDNKVESFDITAHSDEPALLTKEEIVQGILPRLWLRQFSRTNATAIHPTSNAQFTISTTAPAYIQDGEISGRTIAECTITGTINENSIDGQITIAGGKLDKQTSPIGLFRDTEKTDKYAIFVNTKFEAKKTSN